MKNMKRFAIIGGLAMAGLATAGGLKAFPNVEMWADDPSQGIHAGDGNLWATASVSDWGISCNHCHINDKNQQGMITTQISSNPPLTGGKYTPGTTYTVTFKLLGEHLGMNDPVDNKNGLTVTSEDANGNPVGQFLGDMQTSCPTMPPTLPDGALVGSGATTYAYADPTHGNKCRAVAALGVPNKTQWSFKWTAPAAGTGTVTMYYGVVDGDADQRSLGDDVKMGKQQLMEGP